MKTALACRCDRSTNGPAKGTAPAGKRVDGGVPEFFTITVSGVATGLITEGETALCIIHPVGVDPETGATQEDPCTPESRYIRGGGLYLPPVAGFTTNTGTEGAQGGGNMSGQHYMWNRVYDINTGRWTTPDPAMQPWWNLLDYSFSQVQQCEEVEWEDLTDFQKYLREQYLGLGARQLPGYPSGFGRSGRGDYVTPGLGDFRRVSGRPASEEPDFGDFRRLPNGPSPRLRFPEGDTGDSDDRFGRGVGTGPIYPTPGESPTGPVLGGGGSTSPFGRRGDYIHPHGPVRIFPEPSDGPSPFDKLHPDYRPPINPYHGGEDGFYGPVPLVPRLEYHGIARDDGEQVTGRGGLGYKFGDDVWFRLFWWLDGSLSESGEPRIGGGGGGVGIQWNVEPLFFD